MSLLSAWWLYRADHGVVMDDVSVALKQCSLPLGIAGAKKRIVGAAKGRVILRRFVVTFTEVDLRILAPLVDVREYQRDPIARLPAPFIARVPDVTVGNHFLGREHAKGLVVILQCHA